jgi:hypothetical protein
MRGLAPAEKLTQKSVISTMHKALRFTFICVFICLSFHLFDIRVCAHGVLQFYRYIKIARFSESYNTATRFSESYNTATAEPKPRIA